MNTYTEHEIRDLLTPKDTPVPPADLAERIKSEIPERLEVTPVPENVVAFSRRWPRQRTFLLAASVLVTLGGAFLFDRLQNSLDAPELAARMAEPVAPAPAIRADEAIGIEEEAQAFVPAPAEGAAAPAVQEAKPARKRQRDDKLAEQTVGGAKQLREKLKAVGYLDEAAPRKEGAAEAPEPELRRSLRQASEYVDALETTPDDAEAGADESGVSLVTRPDSNEWPGSGRFAGGAKDRPPAPQAAPPEPLRLAEVRAPSETRVSSAGAYEKAEAIRPPIRPTPVPVPPPANPNDEPYDAVYFEDYGTNPFIDTEDDALSTFGLDVDTASYSVARRFLADGHLPDPDAIRPEELINYFDYGDEPPRRGDFAIHAEGAPSIFGEGERYYLLRFHLRGRDLGTRERRPAHLTFVVDVSGSMAREDRLELVKQALGLLVDQLREDDRIALVVYGSRGRVVLPHTSDHSLIRRALSELRPEGSTNAGEGLRLGYELAREVRRRGTINRVILCSDGVANVGTTSAEAILEQVAGATRDGVELTTVGFGMGNFNDVLMEKLADRGNGRYAYVDTLEEARRIFVENLTGTLQTIAAEARVQVEFNPEVVSRYRLVGYENRDIADHRFRDDTVDAGEIGAGHAVTALYELKLRGELPRRDEVATLHLRYGSVIGGEIVETERKVTGRDFAGRWESSSRALRLTSLVAEFAEILKGTYWARTGDLDRVFRLAQEVAVEYPGDVDVAEFVSLVGKAARYRR